MDIRSFFNGASSSKSADVSSSSEDEVNSNQSDTECLEPSPAKKQLTIQEIYRSKYRPVTSSWKYVISLQRRGGTWISKPFKNWKKVIEKMKMAIEITEKLSNSDLDGVISVWNRIVV